jgi:hypothetical protein
LGTDLVMMMMMMGDGMGGEKMMGGGKMMDGEKMMVYATLTGIMVDGKLCVMTIKATEAPVTPPAAGTNATIYTATCTTTSASTRPQHCLLVDNQLRAQKLPRSCPEAAHLVPRRRLGWTAPT